MAAGRFPLQTRQGTSWLRRLSHFSDQTCQSRKAPRENGLTRKKPRSIVNAGNDSR